MSFLDDIPRATNDLDPEFSFIVKELLTKLDGVRRDNLGTFTSQLAFKQHIIQRFVKSFRTHIGNDISQTVRLLMPNKDYRLYEIKEKNLAALIMKMYNIKADTFDGDILLKWKSDYRGLLSYTKDKNYNSLPQVVTRVVTQKRTRSKPKSYTVSEINEILDQLTEMTKSDERIALLKPVFNVLPADQLRWFLNCILKESNLGYDEKLFFSAWNKDTHKLFKICNDIQKSFNYFSINDTIDPELLVPQLFYPFSPQSSHKIDISYADLCHRMKQFYIEEKIDGDRMLLHYSEGKFKFFTRRARDYTNVYGHNFEAGSLTKYLHGAFNPKVKSIILDGEVVGFDSERLCILPFGTLRSSAIQEARRQFHSTDMYEAQGAWPLFLIFDIVHLNGKSTIKLPLIQRKQLLQSCLNEVTNRFEILRYQLCSKPQDIEKAVKNVIVERSEGIMVKHFEGAYHFGERKKNWLKVKPEYLDKFGENLDLVVIGVIHAKKNSYICGLYDKEEKVWRSFCKVANGFTNTEFDMLNRELGPKETKECPSDFAFGKTKPEYYIRPEDSIVLEIVARSFDQRTDGTYATATTLRNLYCRRIRQDKSWEECILYQDYENERKSRTHQVEQEQKVRGKKRKPELSFLESKINLSVTQPHLFRNFRFVLCSDKRDRQEENIRISVNTLKELVERSGGKVYKSVPNDYDDKEQLVVVSEIDVFATKAAVDKGFDIVHPDWILNCVDQEIILPLDKYSIFRNVSGLAENVDEYGDSYYSTPRIPLQDYLLQLEIEYPTDENADLDIEDLLLNLLAGTKFLLVTAGFNYSKELLTAKIQQFRGTVVGGLPADYIVVSDVAYNSRRNQVLQELNELMSKVSETYQNSTGIPNVVRETFVDASAAAGVKVDPQDHKVA